LRKQNRRRVGKENGISDFGREEIIIIKYWRNRMSVGRERERESDLGKKRRDEERKCSVELRQAKEHHLRLLLLLLIQFKERC
jgi:hypothetical protein